MKTFEAKRLLRRYGQKDGNWRFRGLMLSVFEDPETVGRAWLSESDKKRVKRALSDEDLAAPRSAFEDKHFVPPGTNEYAAAKSVFSERELQEGIDKDKYISRMLLESSPEELDVLWREELLDTIIQGAEPRKIARDASDVINVNTRRGDIPRGSSQVYASQVAEGAEIPMDSEDYDTVPFDCDKYGQGFMITDELISMANPDVVERQVRWVGESIENAINRRFLNTLVDNAGKEHDTAGTNQDVTMVNRACELVEIEDYGAPDTMVQHPEFKTALFEDSNLAYANRAGSSDVIQNRTYNQLLGLEMFTASDGTHNSSSNTWGFNNDGEIGAVAYNRDFVSTVVWRDIEAKDFDDPIRDLQGGNARAYFDVVYRQPNAAARIEY